MGHWEDFWWDTTRELKELGLQEEFNKELKKMDTKNKHRYKDTRSRWEYAFAKVLKKYIKKNGSTN